jgi:hypothetical protein
MGERPSEYERAANDWYVEPAGVVDRLFDNISFEAGVHDPCCGLGTIVEVARRRGILATGADLIDRASGKFPVRNFFDDKADYARNIVTNPPFNRAMDVVEHALQRLAGAYRVAIIAQAKFLFSQRRHPLFSHPWMEKVLVLSTRPSMPPGQLLLEKGEECRGNGSMDYVWCIWCKWRPRATATIEWVL